MGTDEFIGLFTMDVVDRLVWLFEGCGGFGSVEEGWRWRAGGTKSFLRCCRLSGGLLGHAV
jgi:hypothetical protein